MIIYVSKLYSGFLLFQLLKPAHNANDIILCENESQSGYHHKLTIWKFKDNMIEFINVSVKFRSKGECPSIALKTVIVYDGVAISS